MSHYETVTEYPERRQGRAEGHRCRAYRQGPRTEQVPVQRYIRYTAEEELAAREEERKKGRSLGKLPETVAALQDDNKTLERPENAMPKQCLMEMSEIV